VLGCLTAVSPVPAQTQSNPAAGSVTSAPTTPAPQIDARTLTCQALQARVRKQGPVVVSSGGAVAGDVYHAQSPRCEFWQRPQFSFVMAQDGWCAAGYVCAMKFQGH
jgi:hypothetical protein